MSTLPNPFDPLSESTTFEGWFAPRLPRGTLDIIWGCVTTIFICVWASLHLNLPSPHESQLRILCRKLKWLIIGVLAPEFVVYVAIKQWNDARLTLKTACAQHYGWTMTHGFFANMGGWATTDGKTLTAPDIFMIHEGSANESFHDNNAKAINDRSKASYIVKFIACVQATWFVVQCIARGVQRLPLATLEIVTLGYVICALANYLFWWQKPQDVMTPITVITSPRQSMGVERMRNTMGGSNSAAIIAITVAFVVGGVHCVLWNGKFPTPAERDLWRISSVLLILPPFLMLGDPFLVLAQGYVGVGVKRLFFLGFFTLFLIIVVPLFLAARFFLVLEPFLSLREVPSGTYMTIHWATLFPHL